MAVSNPAPAPAAEPPAAAAPDPAPVAAVETPAAEPPAAEPPAAAPDDEFANAFSEFSVEPKPAEPPAAETPPAAPAPEAAPAAETPPTAPAAEPPAAAAPEAEAAPDPKEVDAIIKRIGEVVGAQKAPEPAPAAPATPAPEQPIYTAEEQAQLTKFAEDWPDVAQVLPIIQKQVNRDLVRYVFDEVGSVVRDLKATVDALAYRAHSDDLHQTVGDYSDQERDEIIAWADKQPAYLQTAYKNVIQQGTAEEVADLVSRYREVTGKHPAPAAPVPPAAPQGGSELSEPAKKAVEALAPVSSKRSEVLRPDDKSDFDGAFAKFSELFGT